MNFGSERTDHITFEDKERFFNQLHGKGIMMYIEEVHFNPNVTENHNIIPYENNRKKFMVYVDNKWISLTKSEISEKIIGEAINALLIHCQ